MRQHTIKIAAGVTEENTYGENVYIRLDSASVAVTFEDPDSRSTVTLEQGDAVRLREFRRLRIRHDAVTEQVIAFSTAPSGEEVFSSSVSGLITLDQGGTLEHGAVVTALSTAATLIAAADPGRRALHVKNAGLINAIRIGGAGVTITNGAIELLPGEEWREEAAAAAAWYAIADTDISFVTVMSVK